MLKRNVFRSFKRPNEKKGKKKESQVVLSFQEEKIDQQAKELTDAEKQLFQEALGKGNEGETSKACIAGQQGASNIIGQTLKKCIDLGHVFRKGNEIDLAIHHYEQALKVAHTQEDHFNATEALRGLGRIYREADENEKAIGYYEQALSSAQVGNNKMQEAEVFLGLAHAYENNKQSEIAIKKYTTAKEIANEANCKWEEIEACRGLGLAFSDLGDFKTAMQYFHEALDIAPKKGYEKNLQLIYLDLAHTYKSNGEYEKAIKNYKKAEEILALTSNSEFNEMSLYLGLGNCLTKIGHIKEGEEYFTKAEKVAEKKWNILPAVLHVMNHPYQADCETVDQTPIEEGDVKVKETVKEKKNIKGQDNVKEPENVDKGQNVNEEVSFQQNTFPLNGSDESNHNEEHEKATESTTVAAGSFRSLGSIIISRRCIS